MKNYQHWNKHFSECNDPSGGANLTGPVTHADSGGPSINPKLWRLRCCCCSDGCCRHCHSSQHWRRWLLNAKFYDYAVDVYEASQPQRRTYPRSIGSSCTSLPATILLSLSFVFVSMLILQQHRHSTPLQHLSAERLLLMLHVVVCRLWQMSFTLLYVHTHTRTCLSAFLKCFHLCCCCCML